MNIMIVWRELGSSGEGDESDGSDEDGSDGEEGGWYFSWRVLKQKE